MPRMFGSFFTSQTNSFKTFYPGFVVHKQHDFVTQELIMNKQSMRQTQSMQLVNKT